jgi:hypothetical protein
MQIKIDTTPSSEPFRARFAERCLLWGLLLGVAVTVGWMGLLAYGTIWSIRSAI